MYDVLYHLDTNAGSPCLYFTHTYTGATAGLALRGESGLLCLSVLRREAPVGILLDRLEEYPEECECPPDELARVIRQLRERNPNGNETNW